MTLSFVRLLELINPSLAIEYNGQKSSSPVPRPKDLQVDLSLASQLIEPSGVVKHLEHFLDIHGSCGDIVPGLTDPLGPPSTTGSVKSLEIDSVSLSSLNARDSIIASGNNTLSANERLSAYLEQFVSASSNTGLHQTASTISLTSKDSCTNLAGVSQDASPFTSDGLEGSIWQPPVPHMQFVHNLYLYPRSLNLNCKHGFPRARNLSCYVELRASDDLCSAPLRSFYLRESSLYKHTAFDTWLNTSVLYHEAAPQFNEEIKLCLPFDLLESHHLLFRFYHVSCDTAGSGLDKLSSSTNSPDSTRQLESPTGFAWLPLLTDTNSLQSGSFHLPICQELQSGYLSSPAPTCQPRRPILSGTQLMHGFNPHWIENGKPLFQVDLLPFSSVYTADAKIGAFFSICARQLGQLTSLKPHNDSDAPKTRSVKFSEDDPVIETIGKAGTARPTSVALKTNGTAFSSHGNSLSNAIKSLLLTKQRSVVQFLPALLNQFMEIFYIVCKNGEMRFQTCSKSDAARGWLFTYQVESSGSPGDLLKTAIGSVLTSHQKKSFHIHDL
ncbi:Dedicator of cytokinesis protein 10 [Cichlidogyrus casuarinus]|uniref:Dedicator of cytokinesis protein 10 n=1 Tax=Cichlidogyrus casuarinus TaxID=1844966 RepID=A0ABD2QK50_9PLAT